MGTNLLSAFFSMGLFVQVTEEDIDQVTEQIPKEKQIVVTRLYASRPDYRIYYMSLKDMKYVIACTFKDEDDVIYWHLEIFEADAYNPDLLHLKHRAIEINSSPWIPDVDIIFSGNIAIIMDKFLGPVAKAEAQEIVREDHNKIALDTFSDRIWLLKNLEEELTKPLFYHITQIFLQSVGLKAIVIKSVC